MRGNLHQETRDFNINSWMLTKNQETKHDTAIFSAKDCCYFLVVRLGSLFVKTSKMDAATAAASVAALVPSFHCWDVARKMKKTCFSSCVCPAHGLVARADGQFQAFYEKAPLPSWGSSNEKLASISAIAKSRLSAGTKGMTDARYSRSVNPLQEPKWGTL